MLLNIFILTTYISFCKSWQINKLQIRVLRREDIQVYCLMTDVLSVSNTLLCSSFYLLSYFLNPTSYGILESRYLTGGGLGGPP